MELPPAVVGFFVTIYLWRNGQFGFLVILCTPTAMIISQVVIATPIVTGIRLAAMKQLTPGMRLQDAANGSN